MPSRSARGVTIGLAVYAVAAPLLVAGIIASGLVPKAAPAVIMIGLGLALLGPGLAAIILALRGVGAVTRDLTMRADSEPQQAILRLFVSGAVLVYLGALAYWGESGDAILPLLAVDLPGMLTAWLLFVHLMANPAPSRPRRAAAMVNDVTLLSVFLHVGGAYAAPWFGVYLWLVLGFGFRFGVKAMIACTALALAGFAAVFVTTDYWELRWPIAAGIPFALVLLPSTAASFVRRLGIAKDETAAATKDKNRLLAILGHELRAPLNSVIGMGLLMGRTQLDPDQRDMLASVQYSARSLLGLVNDLFDLSQLDAGKLPPAIESFVLTEVLGGAVALIRPPASAKGLALTLRIDPRLPHVCRGLPQQLRQAMVYLLANAVTVTRKGHVDLRATLSDRDEGWVSLALAVRDGGPGIAREEQAHLFDMNADKSPQQRGGIGLAIAKRLAEMMGGDIAVASEIGKGSTFTVTLTLAQDPSDSVRAPDLAGQQLVLISDDTEFAGAVEGKLKLWRGQVLWIDDAEKALGELALAGRSNRPAVVIIDGSQDPLAGLSLAHRAATAMAIPPVMLFIAPERGSDAIAGLATAQIAAVVEAPLSDGDLASALLGILAGDERLARPLELDPPPASAAAVPQALEVPSVAATKPLKVLVAEDNAASARLVKSVLESAGHEVEIASDGEAALGALERTRFDIALLDINMPEISGYEVAKLYRIGHVGEQRLPIVALTADATSETERLCREAGMDAVLTKPVEAAQLLSTLDEIHARLIRPERIAVGAPQVVVTPITAHPRFVPDSGATVDESTFEALKNLGGSDFVFEVVDTFRKDGTRLIEQLKQAAEKADLREFRDLMHSLRSGAANVGGVKLCQTLTGLRDVSTKDLRASGASYVEKIQGEMTRLDAILGQLLESQRRG
ncbi:MAG TPA: response regulator [Stellaceae bacterium]